MTDHRVNHVFLSYSEENEAFVESLAERLRRDPRISVWFYPWDVIPGTESQAQMATALRESQVCAIFVGPDRIGAWQNKQMQVAIEQQVERNPEYRVVPVLLPGIDKEDLPAFLGTYREVQIRSFDDERAFKYLIAGILGIRPIEVEGFLEPIPGWVPLPDPREVGGAGKSQVDPDNPPIRTIRKLLVAAFDSDTLYRFCQERTDFRDVLTTFGTGDGLAGMVDKVITFCGTELLWDELLAEVEKENPRQYARFEPELRAEMGGGLEAPTGEPVRKTPKARGKRERTTPALPPTGPIRNRWALLVGVNRYVDPTFPRLDFCVNDVVSLDEMLRSQGYTTIVLHDDLPRDDRLFPNRDNVEAELIRLCGAAGPDDLLWAHFACHGKLVDGNPVLITNETRASTLAKRALPLAEVESQMRASEARRLVITLDACHVGIKKGRSIADPEFIRNAHELAEGFALLAASTDQQIAQEWEEVQHGVFSYYLLEGLSGRADRAGKRFVTVSDLATHVLDGLRRWYVEHGTEVQEPTARTEMMGDMILADHREELERGGEG
jgi:hypothetical protein